MNGFWRAAQIEMLRLRQSGRYKGLHESAMHNAIKQDLLATVLSKPAQRYYQEIQEQQPPRLHHRQELYEPLKYPAAASLESSLAPANTTMIVKAKHDLTYLPSLMLQQSLSRSEALMAFAVRHELQLLDAKGDRAPLETLIQRISTGADESSADAENVTNENSMSATENVVPSADTSSLVPPVSAPSAVVVSSEAETRSTGDMSPPSSTSIARSHLTTPLALASLNTQNANVHPISAHYPSVTELSDEEYDALLADKQKARRYNTTTTSIPSALLHVTSKRKSRPTQQRSHSRSTSPAPLVAKKRRVSVSTSTSNAATVSSDEGDEMTVVIGGMKRSSTTTSQPHIKSIKTKQKTKKSS